MKNKLREKYNMNVEDFKSSHKKKVIDFYEKTSIDYILGEFIGHYIIYNFLPTVDILGPNTRHFHTTTTEEKEEYERLSNIWFEKRLKDGNDGGEEWKELRKYSGELIKKYLPASLECHVPLLKWNDIETLKRGIQVTLWNSDYCYYNIRKLDDIEIEEFNHNDPSFYTKITLKLDE